jgi:glyoxylase-like metal-dependent hydrolase (beta-lactamase superfamily II)
MEARIDRLPAGPGATCNTWLIGDDEEVIVVDPGSDAAAVLAAAGERDILAVICTHGHASVAACALAVAERDDSPVALHPDDMLAWREHADEDPDIEMAAGGIFEVADVALEVIHTPGHSPGSVSLYCEDLGAVCSGDALGSDGPVPHAGEFPDFAGQMSAIGEELLTLPGGTRVLPGHGDEITVAEAEKRFDAWVSSGPSPAETAD